MLKVRKNHQLVVSIDTMVADIHFHRSMSPEEIGYKLLAVNLSDIAAMGATPLAASLRVSIPEGNATWLDNLRSAISKNLSDWGLYLLTQEVCAGPLNLSLQIYGEVLTNSALLRSRAQVGDQIYVTGTLGDAGAGLAVLQETDDISPDGANYFLGKLTHPTPRVAIGQGLLPLASAAIDISDGLLSDLQHLVTSSGVGAEINIKLLPLSYEMHTYIERDKAIHYACTAGDDYELCFCCPIKAEEHLQKLSTRLNIQISRIGRITKDNGIAVIGNNSAVTQDGYDHFK